MTNNKKDQLSAVYYPFSRCLNEETLKRAVLLYDRLLFIDPKTPKIRQGLYSVENHQAYLPNDAAHKLSKEWEYIEKRYDLLIKEKIISFIDPSDLIDPSDDSANRLAVDQLMTQHLQADMGSQEVFKLFESYPKSWSILRSRIPKTSFQYLSHQYTERVLYEQNTEQPFDTFGGKHYALFADGKPEQEYSLPGYGEGSRPEVKEEFACVVPYYLGSSLSVSLMLVVSSNTGAIPLTDSNAHHKLLSLRFKRAAEALAGSELNEIPGLTAIENPGLVQKRRLIEMRLVDSILSAEDLKSISLEDCLKYRQSTEKQRHAFIDLLSDLTSRIKYDAWSPEIEQDLKEEIKKIQDTIDEQKASLRKSYEELFHKAAIGVAISIAPILLNAVFPGISIPMVFLLGAGVTSGLLVEPIKDLVQLWAKNRNDQKNSLTYLLDLKGVRKH